MCLRPACARERHSNWARLKRSLVSEEASGVRQDLQAWGNPGNNTRQMWFIRFISKQTEGVDRAAHVSISNMKRNGRATVKTWWGREGARRERSREEQGERPTGGGRVRAEASKARHRFLPASRISHFKEGSCDSKTRSTQNWRRQRQVTGLGKQMKNQI